MYFVHVLTDLVADWYHGRDHVVYVFAPFERAYFQE